MQKKDKKTEQKITMQVMADWYTKFCQSKYYSKMKKTAQKNSERAILDLLCIMYYEFDIEPDEWSPEVMEKYCLFKLLDDLYYERDEAYFKVVSEILLGFFNFLRDLKLQKNADSILNIIQTYGTSIFKDYQSRSEEDDEEYSDEVLQEIIDDIEELLIKFTESNYYFELNDKYKEYCENIIITFSQFMYEYNLLKPNKWNNYSLFEVCIDVMPRKVMADDEYFEALAPSLKAFFLFMNENKINHNALSLVKEIESIESKIIKASKKSSNWGVGKQLLSQAIKKGVDLSDKSKLTSFLNSMMGKPLPSTGYEEIEETAEEEFYNESEYDNVVPFVRKTDKLGRNDPCSCGSGKKYKKCCGK